MRWMNDIADLLQPRSILAIAVTLIGVGIAIGAVIGGIAAYAICR